MNLQTTNYREVGDQLGLALSWFESHGIRIQNTRLKKYQAALSLFESHLNSVGYKAFFESKEIDEHLAHCYEAEQIIYIFRNLSQFPTQEIEDSLKIASHGPVLAFDENPKTSSNRPRNILFELLMLSVFSQTGTIPSLRMEADIDFNFRATNIFVECKRPSSAKQIKKRITDGLHQLNTRIKNSNKDSYGLLAISLEKLCRFKDRPNVVNQIQEAALLANHSIEKFHTTFGSLWDNAKERRILGTVLYFGSTFGIFSEQRVCLIRHYKLCPRQPIAPREEAFLKSLFQNLNENTKSR